MSLRPYLQQSGGARFYLPGDITSQGISHSGGIDLMKVKIPQQAGEKNFSAASSVSAEQVTVSGILRSADYADAAAWMTEYTNFKTAVRNLAESNHSVEFGWYDTLTSTELLYTSDAYVTTWSMTKSPLLPYKPADDMPWSVTITIPDPTTWSDSGAGTPTAPADNIYLQADTIRLIAGTLVEIRDGSNNLVVTVDTANGKVRTTGDYGFL